MPFKAWTPEQIQEVRRLLASGMMPREIAKALGRRPSAVSGVLFRAKMTKPLAKPRGPLKREGGRRYREASEIRPSKAPFAPDSTVPDFAWDDDHCAAVMAFGGYPACTFRRAA